MITVLIEIDTKAKQCVLLNQFRAGEGKQLAARMGELAVQGIKVIAVDVEDSREAVLDLIAECNAAKGWK